jgi:hypothetical protein
MGGFILAMSKLEVAILKLAQAADEFDRACTEVYKTYKSQGSTALYSGKAQIYLQDDVRKVVSDKVLTAGQARAIQGAFSGWRPPQVSPVRSLPLAGRSGGAA